MYSCCSSSITTSVKLTELNAIIEDRLKDHSMKMAARQYLSNTSNRAKSYLLILYEPSHLFLEGEIDIDQLVKLLDELSTQPKSGKLLVS
jgi:hypothetical protein